MSSVSIRSVAPDDATAITPIYAEHVLTGAGSYEIEPPDLGAMRSRIARVSEAGWPWLVAEVDARVVGYCYAAQMNERPGYLYTAEDSVYVAAAMSRRGVGTALLRELILKAERFGFRQMIAVVGGAEAASIALHSGLGFRHAGRLEAVGWKHGRWLDNVHMQRALGAGSSSPGSDMGRRLNAGESLST